MQASIENIKTHMNPALCISEYLHCVILYSLFENARNKALEMHVKIALDPQKKKKKSHKCTLSPCFSVRS